MAEYSRLAPAKLESLISESLSNKASYIFWVTGFYGVLSRKFLDSTPKLVCHPESFGIITLNWAVILKLSV